MKKSIALKIACWSITALAVVVAIDLSKTATIEGLGASITALLSFIVTIDATL
jgi:hypothetical protein